MAYSIACEHPRVIINPKLPELLHEHRSYVFRGQTYDWNKVWRHALDFDWKLFAVRRNGIKVEDVENCYVLDKRTGETFPMYYIVPCNHCDVCKVRRMNDYTSRMLMESQLYDVYPWFVTLTYRESDRPKDGVSKRDCQLFLKRFRINLARAGFTAPIRYLLVAEYGASDRTSRPHYHAVFWNIQSKTNLDYLRVRDILEKSWQHGIVKSRLVTAGSDDKGFQYTFKYTKREKNPTPPGQNEPFVLSSRRNGGIGAPFIDDRSADIRKHLDTTYEFLDKWTGKRLRMLFTPYVINRLFPTFSRSVPAPFRRAVVEAIAIARTIFFKDDRHSWRVEFARKLHFEYCKFFYTGYGSPCDAMSFYKDYERESCFDSCLPVIRKFLAKLLPMEYYQKLHDLRHLFLAKMFLAPRQCDVKSLAYSAQLVLSQATPYTLFH